MKQSASVNELHQGENSARKSSWLSRNYSKAAKRLIINLIEAPIFTNVITFILKIISDAEVEPEPLWEYPCRAEAEPKPIMTFDLTQDIEVQNSIAKFTNLNLKKRGSGMVFWMQWFLTEEDIVNTGPVKDVRIGQHIGKISYK